MSTQKTRQAGRAIRTIRSVWIVEIKEKGQASFSRCETFFIHFFAQPLTLLLIGGQVLQDGLSFAFIHCCFYKMILNRVFCL
jgi:hypothetical protein